VLILNCPASRPAFAPAFLTDDTFAYSIAAICCFKFSISVLNEALSFSSSFNRASSAVFVASIVAFVSLTAALCVVCASSSLVNSEISVFFLRISF
jgi:hypothetical protein